MKFEDVPVNNTDELTEEGGRRADRVRTIGEYSPTNMPLSEHELVLRSRLGTHWVARTPENIAEITPLAEDKAQRE
ncbi:MAG TPA: hypothetical protein VKX49_30375 [Bryobacteraceae bacterium]|nr:hypothetical protein [Bryobacteraceae bacterium]